jgi:methylamine dehydrogenase heavy chain
MPRALAIALLLLAAEARAQIAPEPLDQVSTLPAPRPHWLWVGDLVFKRAALFDADEARFLGMLSSGVGVVAPLVSVERSEVYLPETYYSRASRGTRSDVVTVYDLATLTPEAEIAIPPKRADVVHGMALAALLDDGRFLAIFNLTPATSVTVVDTVERRLAGEIETPGCSLVYPAGPRRFAMLCGDGALSLVTLNERGAEAARWRSAPFFDPEKDPVTEKAVRRGSSWFFVSFDGLVREVDLSGENARFAEPWSLFNDAERGQAWKIGGAQHLALHEASGRLYALVHQGGPHGHKEPGTEVWVYDVAQRTRVHHVAVGNLMAAFLAGQMGLQPGGVAAYLLDAIVPSVGADSIAVTQDDAPRLFTVSGSAGAIGVHDARTGEWLRNITDVGLAPGVLSAPWR